MVVLTMSPQIEASRARAEAAIMRAREEAAAREAAEARLRWAVEDRAANLRGPGGPTGPLRTPSRTP
jgi:hypothetical protein